MDYFIINFLFSTSYYKKFGSGSMFIKILSFSLSITSGRSASNYSLDLRFTLTLISGCGSTKWGAEFTFKLNRSSNIYNLMYRVFSKS